MAHRSERRSVSRGVELFTIFCLAIMLYLIVDAIFMFGLHIQTGPIDLLVNTMRSLFH
ncbi:MAG: hypothetical protein ABR887_04520 [Methanoregulaceae archaeon]|jgi:hypothetical protein